jgi:hypothetical protein
MFDEQINALLRSLGRTVSERGREPLRRVG